jgi:glycine/D-amino acid oxidase-like deaminating enzyme
MWCRSPMPHSFADDFRAEPYWWDAAAPSDGSGEMPAPADVAIVGGGYAGLSAALTLRRLGRAVLVLDAERIGWGASSRNGGMVSGGLKLAGDALERRFGAVQGRVVADAAAASFPFIEQVIAGENIDCDYVRCGRFVPAWTPRHFAAQAAKAGYLAEITGLPTRMVPRSRQREELGSDHYAGGMVVEATGSLHPGKYARGLADAARRAGAVLRGGVRVASIVPERGGFRVQTSRGELRANQMLVATNGYSLHRDGTALPWLARRIVPVASYIIATEPLGAERVKTLFPTLRMVADTKRVLNYFRPSPDGTRVLWGGRASFRSNATAPERAAPVLWRMMTAVFPELRAVRITHAWTGNVAFTFDGLPHIGVQEGVHYAAGCQGSGVAMATWLGHQAALSIAGAANAPFALDRRNFPTVLGYRGRPWFLPLVGEWMRLRDRIDRSLG